MSARNVEIVREVFEAQGRRDWDDVYDLYSPDIEWDGGILWGDWGDGGVARGRDGLRDAWRRWIEAFEFATFEAYDYLDVGDDVLVRVRMHARGRGSGLETDQVLALVWTVTDGLVVRVRAYTELEEARAAVGLGKSSSGV
jgi:ketosteroid isomerase-like protein